MDRPKVLTIDDNALILAKLKGTLEKDYNVISAKGGVVAFKYLEKKLPDIILLDCEMPDMNGFEVIAKLKLDERTKDIPVIFLTGSIGPEIEAQALNAGAVDYIQKPIVDEVVLGRLKTQIELQKYKKHLEFLVMVKTEEILKKSEQIRKREEMTFKLLAYVTDYRDKITGGHVMRTTNYVRILANKLKEKQIIGYEIDDEYAEILAISANLHDLGKIAIPDSILLKTERLTTEEFDIIKKHTIYGVEILEKAFNNSDDVAFLKVAKEMMLTHQEKWNGEGYPNGLQGNMIPLSGRLMAVADVYDALTSPRTYKSAMTHEEAFNIIVKQSGKGFDPIMINVLEEVKEEFKEQCKQLWNVAT